MESRKLNDQKRCISFQSVRLKLWDCPMPLSEVLAETPALQNAFARDHDCHQVVRQSKEASALISEQKHVPV